MKEYKKISFPNTRTATFDVFETGLKLHHVKGLLELDVTEARRLVEEYRNNTKNQTLSKEDIALGSKRNKFSDSLYYLMPGFIRRFFWRFVYTAQQLLKN